MNITNTVLQYLMFLFESLIFWRVISGALDTKYHKKLYILLGIIQFILLSSKKIVFNIPEFRQYLAIGTIVLIGYTFLTFICLSKNSIKEKLIWVFIYTLASAIMEIVPLLIIRFVLHKTLSEISSDSISFSIMLFCKFLNVLLIEAIIRKRKGKLLIGSTYFKELLVIISWNLTLVVCTVYIFANNKDFELKIEKVIFFILSIVFLITVYIVILIFRLEKKSKEEIETHLKLQQIEMELKLNNDMISVTDKLRKLRHDMNNHIGLIKVLAHTKRYDDLIEYIDQIYEDVEIANELVITGNKTVSVLLNSKRSLAKSKNIDFTSMITISDFKMQSKDICALLGNILDNAIEAAEKSGGKKYVQLMIQQTVDGCVISCENSVGMKPIVTKGKFITTKDNHVLHGIGITNMKDIVNKYKGEINFDYDEDMFHVRVLMPI